MKKWLKRVLIALCVTTLGITAAAFVGCKDDGGNSSSVESSVSVDGSSAGTNANSSSAGTSAESSSTSTNSSSASTNSSSASTNSSSASTNSSSATTSADTCAHAWVETVVEATCYAGGYTTKVCSECGDTVTENETAKVACSYTKTTVAATCTEDGFDQFTCKWCNDSYKNVTTRATGHDTEGATWTVVGDFQIEDSCYYTHVEATKCKTCQEEVTFEEEIQKHSYTLVEVTYATCTDAGSKTYACDCGEEYQDPIEIDVNAHAWDGGVAEGNVTTYTCSHDGAHTKKIFSAKEEVAATVPATVLAETGAVELKNAEMKMDADALASIGTGDVNLSAGTADKDTATANMSQEDLEKLGDNEIFDFSMTDAAGEAIAFNGKITVTVPYELGDEDPANIAVWYIGEDGKTEAIPATYSYVNGQGYATFETSHFSYYTVVRLSLEERCNLYGHAFETRVVPAACGVQGYTVTECKKCHKYERSAFTPALAHDYKGVVTNASCSAMGYTTYTCALCGDKYVSDYTAKLTHAYADTVIAPTCTANGYTLHKCSHCGESYTDTVVNAKGHNYDGGVCTECGRKDPTVSENFYFNLVESLATADTFYFEVKDLKVEAEMEYNNGDKEIIVYEMNLARAQIGFDETGIVGKGEGTLIGSMTETGSVNSSETYFATAQFLFANGNMYVYVEGTGLTGEGSGRSTMIMSAPQSMMTEEMEDEMGMSMTMLAQMAEMYGSGLLDIVAGMTAVNDNPLNSAMRAVVEYIYTKTETANGYSFELNEKRLKNMYTIMKEKTISEIFNLVFGATAYQDVQAWLVASVDKKISVFEEEVKTELVNWGISLDEVYAYIDSIAFPEANYPEGERPSVTDYIDQMADVTLLDLINSSAEEGEELTADVVKEMISAYGEQLGALKMSDIMDMMGGMNGPSSNDSSMNGGGVSKPETAEALEEEAAPEVDVDAIIDGIVAFLEKIPVTFTTDKVGTLIDFTVSTKDLDPMEMAELFGEETNVSVNASFTAKFVLNGSYAAEYDHIVKEAEKLAGANNITEDVECEDYTIYVQESGTYIWENYGYWSPVEDLGSESVDGVECQKTKVRIYYGLYVLNEDMADVITATSDCHGWWEISTQWHRIEYAYATIWVNADNDIVKVEFDLSNEETKVSEWSSSYTVYYNPTTGEYAGETQHNYKFVKTVKGEGCARSYDLYRCSVCGMEDRETDYDTGHDWERRYILAEGSVTCEDGVICEEYCTKCGRIDYWYETTSHQFNYENKLVYTSPVCGEVYVRVGVCPCGEKTDVSDRYNWMTDCQIDHVNGEWIDTEGTKYSYRYIDTYACSIEGCGFTYTKENLEWYEYNGGTGDETCKQYDVYTYDFGNGVKLTDTDWWYDHREEGSAIGNGYGGSTYTYTCTLCNQITEIRAYDQYDRTVRVEWPINSDGYSREWMGCDYIEYSLDGEYRYESTEHQVTWTSTSYECTQYSIEGRYCTVCDWYEGYYQAPDYWWHNDHEYYWNGETYVCRRCETKNATGADGWIVLEDRVEGNDLSIGYFNRRDYRWNEFSYAFDNAYVEVIANYNPDDAENPGVVLEGDLFTREVTSPAGVREAGIITLDHDALFNAVHNSDLGISVETVAVVFWVEMTSETTGEAYVIGYGLTFTLGELGL